MRDDCLELFSDHMVLTFDYNQLRFLSICLYVLLAAYRFISVICVIVISFVSLHASMPLYLPES